MATYGFDLPQSGGNALRRQTAQGRRRNDFDFDEDFRRPRVTRNRPRSRSDEFGGWDLRDPNFDLNAAVDARMQPDPAEEKVRAKYYEERGVEFEQDTVGRVVPRGTRRLDDGRADLADVGALDQQIGNLPTLAERKAAEADRRREDAARRAEERRQATAAAAEEAKRKRDAATLAREDEKALKAFDKEDNGELAGLRIQIEKDRKLAGKKLGNIRAAFDFDRTADDLSPEAEAARARLAENEAKLEAMEQQRERLARSAAESSAVRNEMLAQQQADLAGRLGLSPRRQAMAPQLVAEATIADEGAEPTIGRVPVSRVAEVYGAGRPEGDPNVGTDLVRLNERLEELKSDLANAGEKMRPRYEAEQKLLKELRDKKQAEVDAIPVTTRVKSALGSFAAGLAENVAGVSDWVAVTASQLDKKVPEFMRSVKEGKEVDDLATAKFAAFLREKVAELAPADPRLQEEFWGAKVPQAFGNMLGMVAGGAVTKSRYLLPLVMGVGQGGSQGYRDAIRAGATEEQATTAYLLNSGVGATELIPVSRMINRLSKATGGGLKRKLIDGGIEAFEEGLQEFGQSQAAGMIAEQVYGDNRDWVDEAIEGAQVGGVTGALMSFLVSALPGKRRGGKPKEEAKAEPGEAAATPEGQAAEQPSVLGQETDELAVDEELRGELRRETNLPPPGTGQAGAGESRPRGFMRPGPEAASESDGGLVERETESGPAPATPARPRASAGAATQGRQGEEAAEGETPGGERPASAASAKPATPSSAPAEEQKPTRGVAPSEAGSAPNPRSGVEAGPPSAPVSNVETQTPVPEQPPLEGAAQNQPRARPSLSADEKAVAESGKPTSRSPGQPGEAEIAQAEDTSPPPVAEGDKPQPPIESQSSEAGPAGENVPTVESLTAMYAEAAPDMQPQVRTSNARRMEAIIRSAPAELPELLYPGNAKSREVFTKATGVELPKTLKGSGEVYRKWAEARPGAKAPAEASQPTGATFTPAKLQAELTTRFKPSQTGQRAIRQVLTRLNQANPEAFGKMKVVFRKGLDGTMKGRPAAYSPEANVLEIDEAHAENAGDLVVRTIVHEAGHFAERYYLGEGFTQREWESLSDAQRAAAWRQYSGAERSGAELKTDRVARAEWVAMQFARVARGDVEGMSVPLVAKLRKVLEDVRAVVSEWLGDKKLTTAELDAKIVEMLGVKEDAPAAQPPKPVDSPWTAEQIRNVRSRLKVAKNYKADVASLEEIVEDPARHAAAGYKATLDALNDAIAQQQRLAKPTPPKKGAGTLIGQNSEGRNVYQDEQGVRTVELANGIVRNEPVELVPTRGPNGGIVYQGKVSQQRREGTEFETAQEKAARTAPAKPAPKKSALDAATQQQMRDAFDGLAAPSSLAQAGIPADKRGAFFNLGATLSEKGVNTPQRLAQEIDAVIGERGRKYAQALWNAISMSDPTLTGTHDWAGIFGGIDSPTKPAEDTPRNEPRAEQQSATDGQRDPGDRGGGADAGAGRGQPDQNAGDRANRPVLAGASADDVQAPVVSDEGRPAVSGEPAVGQGEQAGDRGSRGEPIPDVSGGDGGSVARPADDGAGEAGVAGKRRRGSATRPDVELEASAPERANYRITDPEAIVGGGPKTRFEKNRKSIETYLDLTASNRQPSAAELDTLAGYTGWGSFGQELFQGDWDRPMPKEGWETQDRWLRDHLGREEWESAQRSIINAHYTDPITVETMWGMVRRMGFAGGRVLEPSVGIGNFFGLMPADLAEKSQLTGIELDRLTGGMARLLYPNANLQIKGYQDSKTSDNFYDLVIGNWPFANVSPADRRYDKFGAGLHDYFFLKALDQVRPGGLVVGITSNSTMDKKSVQVRSALAKKAELVGAYRLPAGAFEKYAGTKVVTDIIVLKKRVEPVSSEVAENSGWLNTQETDTPSGQKIEVNEYWQKNPSHVLGRLNWGHGTTNGRPGMIVERPSGYEAKLRELANRVPGNVMEPWSGGEHTVRYVGNQTTARQHSIVEKGGKFYQVRGEHLALLDDVVKWRVKDAKKTEKRAKELKALVDLREGLVSLLYDQSVTSDDLTRTRGALKKKYDSFVKEHGSLADSSMLEVMLKAGDVSARLLSNLEERNAKGELVPRAILTKDIVRRAPRMENVTVEDAYSIDRYQNITIDTKRIAELAKVSEEQVVEKLSETGQIYKTPAGPWQARDQYLSGNIRQKLREAEDAAQQGMDMARNIEALKAVVPKDIPYLSIEPQLGATWVRNDYYKQFIKSLLGLADSDMDHVNVELRPRGYKVEITRDYIVKKPEATTQWGTKEISWKKIIDAAMNNGVVKITKHDPETGPYTDEKATKEANAKVAAIREEFKTWIWKEPARAIDLQNTYNETFNAVVTPDFDGAHLRLDGLALNLGSGPFDFRKHQKNAVWRGIVNGRLVGAHEVGTGKTFTIAGLALEARRLGMFRKPMLFAHNANSSSVAADIQLAYPGAKVLYVDNLSPAVRDAAMQQIALDDWDVVVLPHSLIDRVTLREETMMAQARELIRELEQEAIDAAEEDNVTITVADMDSGDYKKKLARTGATAKELVKQRERIIQRIKKQAQKARDDSVFFEDMGVDAVIVDEAHIFKKIPIATRQRLKGLNKSGSDRSVLLTMLTDYVKSKNGGKGVFMFTGTPITNTVNEAYNMMRYVMDDTLDRDGVKRWDAWFNAFAESSTDVELTAGGTWEPVERLTQFVNVPELARLAAQSFDVVYAKDMPEFKPRATREGRDETGSGRPFKQKVDITVPMTPNQIAHLEDLRERVRQWSKMSGKDRIQEMRSGGRRSPIIIEGEGVKAALDYRLMDLSAPDESDSKVNRMLTVAMDHYREHPKATQMIFMERGYYDSVTRTKKNKDGSKTTYKVPAFNLANDIVEKLVAQGVPREQIAVFPWLSKDKRKLAAEAMQRSEIRFAIGGTETMGTGVNAQNELRAMHHLDAPWMPGELEQRNGRGWRQGNRWNTVIEYRYFTEGSHDGRRWQILLTKDKFIRRFVEAVSKKGETGLRIIDGDGADLAEGSSEEAGQAEDSDFSESFSSAVGDPRILQRAKLQRRIEDVNRRKTMHIGAQRDASREIDRQRGEIERKERQIAEFEADIAQYAARPAEFSATIEGKPFTDRKKADAALESIPVATMKPWEKKEVGQIAGFSIVLQRGGVVFTDKKWEVAGRTRHAFGGTVASLEGVLRGMSRTPERLRSEIASATASIRNLESLLNTPFPREAQLRGLEKQLAQIERELAQSPAAPPGWLRDGAPVGSLVMFDGKSYDVSAHRWDSTNWWLLVHDPEQQDAELIPIPYDQANDADGNQLFEAREFQKPSLGMKEVPEGGAVPADQPASAPAVSANQSSRTPSGFGVGDVVRLRRMDGLWSITRIVPPESGSDKDADWDVEVTGRFDSNESEIVRGDEISRPSPEEVTQPQELAKPLLRDAQLPIGDAPMEAPRRARLQRLLDDVQRKIAEDPDGTGSNSAKARMTNLFALEERLTKELAKEDAAALKRAKDRGDILGAPAPVEGEPGMFYRSVPDSLIARGMDVARQIYERRGQKELDQVAGEIVDKLGEEEAGRIAVSRDRDGVPGDVRTLVYGQLLARKAARLAADGTTPEQRAELQREVQELLAVKPAQFTELGQEISALQQVYKNVLAATMAQADHEVRKERGRRLGPDGTEAVDDAQKEMEKEREAEIDRETAELERRLRRIPLKKPIWQKYRESAAARLLRIVERQTAPAPDAPPLELFVRRIVDEMRGRVTPLLPQREKPTPPTPAELLREAIDNREKYGEVLSTVRAAFASQYGEGTPVMETIDMALADLGLRPYSEKLLDRAIDEAHRTLRQTIAQLAKEHLTKSDAKAGALADAIVAQTGLSKKDATELSAEIAERLKTRVAAARRKALERLRKDQNATARKKQVLTIIERTVQLNNLGALTEADLIEGVAKKLKIPQLTAERMTELARLANRIETAGSRAEKARAELELANTIRIYKGFDRADLATSIWYANLLSGYATQLANIWGNLVNGTLELATTMVQEPRKGGMALKGWVEGFGDGWTDARSILATGYGRRDFDAKTGFAGQTLEVIDYARDFPDLNRKIAAGLNKHAAALKYVFRVMKAVDAVFYYAAREAFVRVATAKMLDAEYSGAELAAKVKEVLHISPHLFFTAQQQAESEGLEGLDKALRVAAIIEDRRAADGRVTEVTERAEAAALEATFNNDPVGWAGIVYKHLESMSDRLRPQGIPVLKAFLPFLRVPTNIFNASLNYTPLGVMRAYRGMVRPVQRDNRIDFERKSMTPTQRGRLLVQSIGGSLAMAGLYALAQAGAGDDEEPYFTVTASGPTDFGKQAQLRQTGWRPHAIKVGDTWISYKDAGPLILPLAIVGNLLDVQRYQKAKADEGLLSKAVDTAMRSSRVIFDTSMLQGLGTLMDFLQDRSSAERIGSFLTRIPTDVAVPFSNLLRQIDRSFDSTMREADGPLGSVGAALPFVRRTGSERADVLGEPVRSGVLDRFVSTEGNDPLREVLRDKGVFISRPSRETKIGNRTMTPEEHRVYSRISGEAIRSRLEPQAATLRSFDAEKVDDLVDRITAEERRKAKARILRTPAVFDLP